MYSSSIKALFEAKRKQGVGTKSLFRLLFLVYSAMSIPFFASVILLRSTNNLKVLPVKSSWQWVQLSGEASLRSNHEVVGSIGLFYFILLFVSNLRSASKVGFKISIVKFRGNLSFHLFKNVVPSSCNLTDLDR